MPTEYHLGMPVRPMLATLVPAPFDRPGWVFEEKADGIRILAHRRAGVVTMLSRNLLDRTGECPTIEDAIAKLDGGDLVLDGELIYEGAPAYVVFDCLERDGVSLIDQPLK